MQFTRRLDKKRSQRTGHSSEGSYPVKKNFKKRGRLGKEEEVHLHCCSVSKVQRLQSAPKIRGTGFYLHAKWLSEEGGGRKGFFSPV